MLRKIYFLADAVAQITDSWKWVALVYNGLQKDVKIYVEPFRREFVELVENVVNTWMFSDLNPLSFIEFIRSNWILIL